MARVASYGTWSSPITAEMVTRGQVGLHQPMLDRSSVFWLEARPEEAGRVVLVRRAPGGARRELTEPAFSVRTRVHEYGGGAYAVSDGLVVAANFADQRLYRLSEGAAPSPLTPESESRLRYADLEIDAGRGRLLSVREDHRASGEPVNSLVAVGLERAADSGRVLAEGCDFFSSPRLSPDGRHLAWLSWDHPNMPWDGTRLWLAALHADGAPGQPRPIAGGERESIVQPAWSPDGVLHFVSDRTGWWNIYRASDGRVDPVCPMSAEFAGPAWSFDNRWYGFLGSGLIIACFTEDGRWQLGRIDRASGRLERFDLPYTALSGLCVEGDRVVLTAGGPDRPGSIVAVDPASGAVETLAVAGQVPVEARYLSQPRPVWFRDRAGASVHAFHYPPTNPDYAAPADERPPLIVKSHGGPTGSATTELRLALQFWTSRGFAVCDVNYGGSTGFGRQYRERLLGRWGEVDVDDCVSAAQALSADKEADGARLAISGGSAGGFTTLCALTFRDVFRAGASHYGISDLEALARDTHKFESRYLDRLVGPYPQSAEIYRARSPIHHVDRLSCPIIFFQGLEDAVVPPSQAQRMVEALRRKGLPVAYLTFEGEQHGFRRAKTIQTVLRAELVFYGRVFGFEPADGLPGLVIEKL